MKGKVVVIFAGEPKTGDQYTVSGTSKSSAWGHNINKKAILAKQKGAVALFLINSSMENFSSTLIENSKTAVYFPREKNANTEKVPVVTITPGIFTNIFGEQRTSILIAAAKAGASLEDYKAEEKVKTKLEYERKKMMSTASNVVGFIEGSDKKDEYVFLTAHYDHLGKKGDVIYYGADDDGSGTASVIEMAAAFAKAKADGFIPRRTIVFMTVSGEEKGLVGIRILF